MKKLFFLLFVPILIGCSSESVQKQTIQMNDVKWSCAYPSFMSEEDISKQKTLFELVPGPQELTVTVKKIPGETFYYFDLYLKLRLNRSVDIDFSKILANKERKGDAMDCAGLIVSLLDRNGEIIQMRGPMGACDCNMFLFDENWREDFFVDYLTFLQSEPGTVFTLHAISGWSDQQHGCSIGFPNLIKEVKGVEIRIGIVDREFEKYVGEIK